MTMQCKHSYWCVSLKGDDWFLKLLAREEECAWRIEEEDGTYYLVAPEFQECSEAGEVWRLAQDLVPQLDRAAGLVFNNYSGISVDKPFEVFQNGERQGTAFVEVRFGAIAGFRAAPHVESGRSYIRDAYEMVITDPAVDDVSQYWAVRGRSWAFFLWKIYELIREEEAKQQKLVTKNALGPDGRDWVDDDTFQRFRTGANQPTSRVDDKRHAVPIRNPHEQPMNRNEAERFIRGLIRTWITWKYDQLHP